MIKSFFLILLSFQCFAGRAFADFATEMVEATFKFFDPKVTGTCFLVRREAPDTALYLVTAAHMLEGTTAAASIIVLRERQADGSYKRHDHSVPIRRDGKKLWVKHEKDDVAVLRLADSLPVPVGALPLNALADEARLTAAAVHVCSPLFVLTFPKSFEANGAGFPIARQGIVSSHPLVPLAPKHTFIADFTAFGGDSGGPVFMPGADGHPLLLGVAVAQFRNDEQLKMEYEERSLHYPLGLGEVLHAQFIRETIELAAGKDTTKAPDPGDTGSTKAPTAPKPDHKP